MIRGRNGAIRVRVVQPSVAEVAAFIDGGGRHRARMANLWSSRGPVQMFGHEFAGDVLAVGAAVSGLQAGDRVACVEPATEFGQVGYEIGGAFAEYVQIPAECVVRVPSSVSYSDGATIQPVTYADSSVDAARIGLDETVMVFGQGSIGLAIGQLARSRGAGTVIAVARRQETLEAAKAPGADIAVSSDDVGLADVLRELEQEQRIDVAFDAASGPVEVGLSGLATLGWAFQVARPEGRVVVASAVAEPVLLDLQIMQRKGLSMIFPRQRPSADPRQGGRAVRDLGDHHAAGRIPRLQRPRHGHGSLRCHRAQECTRRIAGGAGRGVAVHGPAVHGLALHGLTMNRS